MKYRSVGAADLRLSEIGFGCGGTAGLMIRGSFEERLAVVARALELGINYFDEAPDYGDGESETNLGRVLKELDARPVITTKVEVREADLADVAGHVERSVDASLRRLGLDQVDIVQIHNGPVATSPALRGRDYRVLGIGDYLGPRGALEGLRRIRAAGKARYLGFVCRGDDAPEVRQLIDTGEFSLINIAYSLLNPSATIPPIPGMEVEADFGQVVPYAAAHGVGVVVYSPLASGVLSDGAQDGEEPHRLSGLAGREVSETRRLQLARASRLRFLSDGQGTTLAQAAIRFVLTCPDVTTVLAGVSDLQQLEETAAASELGPLPQDQLTQVEAAWRDNLGMPSGAG